MVAELITVSTEILLGNRINSSASYLAHKCNEMGFSCHHQSVVGEDAEALLETLRSAQERAGLILILRGRENEKNDSIQKTAAALFSKSLKNSDIMVDENGKHLIILPEAEKELEVLLEKNSKAYLGKLASKMIYAQTVKICGMSLEEVKKLVSDLQEEQTNPVFSFTEKISEVHVRVLAKGENEKEAKKIVKPYIKELGVRFGENLYTTEEAVTLEAEVVRMLLAKELTIATAESCTGGLLAGRLVNVSGLSEIFKVGYITYSNKAKRKILGVKKLTLTKHGAVSEETAKEMAKGLLGIAKSKVAVAVTGIAGPDGGSPEKPVGLVYIACNVCGKITVKKYYLQGDREAVRLETVAKALILIRKCILEDTPEE